VSTSVPVVLDLEGYDDGCSAAVRAFVDAWTTGLHQAGRLSGVYGSQSSTMKDVSGLAAAGQAPPDAVWIATDNRRPETTRLTYPPDGTFVGRRLNQFHLDLDRTFGGVTIRVDESAVDVGVLTGTPPVPTPPAVPTVPSAPSPLAVPTTARLAPVTLAKEVAASWSGPAASYDVRVRTGTWRRPLSAPSQPAALQGTTARTTSVRLRPGSTWCYAVRARSASGATSAWSAESCTTSPLDDRRLAARGWTRGTDRAAYLRTTTLTRSPGATLRLPRVRTARVGLVVAPGSRGAVRASIDGKRLGIVRTSGRRGQRVVWLRAGPVRSGTLVLTTVGRAPVRLAGVVLPASG
jgi:hypothetical protein